MKGRNGYSRIGGLFLGQLTIDHSSRERVPVCGVDDAPTAQIVRLLHCHVLSEAAVDHGVGITVPRAGGEHLPGEPIPILVHIVKTRALQRAQMLL